MYSFCASIKNATHYGVDQVFATENGAPPLKPYGVWRAVLIVEAPPLSISVQISVRRLRIDIVTHGTLK